MIVEFDKSKIDEFQKKIKPFNDKAVAKNSFTAEEVKQANQIVLDYYNALSEMGIKYGDLSKDVVLNQNSFGQFTNNYLRERALTEGIKTENIGPLQLNIRYSLTYQDATLRISDKAESNGFIKFQNIANYHYIVFEKQGLFSFREFLKSKGTDSTFNEPLKAYEDSVAYYQMLYLLFTRLDEIYTSNLAPQYDPLTHFGHRWRVSAAVVELAILLQKVVIMAQIMVVLVQKDQQALMEVQKVLVEELVQVIAEVLPLVILVLILGRVAISTRKDQLVPIENQKTLVMVIAEAFLVI